MDVFRLLKKSALIFKRFNKEKKNKDASKGCAPPINDPPDSSQQEEKRHDKNDDDEKACSRDNIKSVTKLFVGCLAHSTTSKELEDYFSRFGKVRNSVVMRHRAFGFVTFMDPESAKAALETKDHVLDGRRINLRPYSPKTNGKKYDNRVFLGSLPFDTTEEDIKQFFMKFGEVEDVTIPLERKTMKPKGFGFLSFKDKFAAEKCIAEGFVYINRRRVLIGKAEPPNPNKINDNLSVDSISDLSIDKNLDVSESVVDNAQFLSVSDDNTSSVVSGERHSIIELNPEIQKFFEDYFLIKFSRLNTMNENKIKGKSNKDKCADSDIAEVEKLLAEFFINSSEQLQTFGENLIVFSDTSECSSYTTGEDTTDEEISDADDGGDTGDSVAKYSENLFQELNAQLSNILENKSKSRPEVSEFKSAAPQMSEFFASQKSLKPFKIKDEKGSLVCSLCQWTPPENSCETFLAHCKTIGHRMKLKERFLSEQNQKDIFKTEPFQDGKRSLEVRSQPEVLLKKHLTQTQESFVKNQNENQKNVKEKEQKQLQSQQPSQEKNVLIKKKKSRRVRKKKKTDEIRTQQNVKSKAENDKTLKVNALAKSMTYIQPLSEHEIICRMCGKIIPKASDTNTLIKNVSHHLQSKGHLKKVLEIEDSLKAEENNKEKKGGSSKVKNPREGKAEKKKVVANAPKIKVSKSDNCRNEVPSSIKQKISKQKEVSKSKTPENIKSNLEKEKPDKKKLGSSTADLKTDGLACKTMKCSKLV